jgi:hypothetical protein
MDSFKTRISKAFPVFSKLFAPGRPALVQQTVITTTGAGSKTVTGIRKDDQFVSVINLTTPADVTGEFRISADDTIDNTGGTAFAASTKLMVTYMTWAEVR